VTGRPRAYDIRKEDLERMRAAGLGRVLIAKTYGCDSTTIRHWLIKYGLETIQAPKPPSQYRMDQLLSQAAIKQREHVYVICHLDGKEPVGPVKVGIGIDPRSRLGSLQIGNPRRLAIWATFLTPEEMSATLIERTVHERLANNSLSGEWFDLDPISAADIVRFALLDLLEKYLGYSREKGRETLQKVETRYLADG
jgi:Meiotically up-regulated gene 113